MNVLFVCNNIALRGNGICTSARNTVANLRARGIDARILAGVNPNKKGPQPDFPLQLVKLPLVDFIIRANGFAFAKLDKGIIHDAIEWADIIHLEEPFILQHKVAKMARAMGKPVVGTFHLYTQNIFYAIGMAWWKGLNHGYMYWWKKRVFDLCSDIHCPSQVVKELLERFHFKAELHVFSNGIIIPEERVIATPPDMEPIKILSIGRFAREKNHKVLLRAMRYSRNAHRIELHFAGTGPWKWKIQRRVSILMAHGYLQHEPIFSFNTAEELKELARHSYLLVHGALVEVEGLSCLESLREGIVPMISKGTLVATSQFALDDRSTFKANDPRELASKIDYWIEHPEERIRMGQEYADSARQYTIQKSIDSLLEMYQKAMQR